MNSSKRESVFAVAVWLILTLPAGAAGTAGRVTIANGDLAGEENSGIRIFKGIPFAQPPVGELRWKAPLPVKNWTGVRQAVQFGPRCMQHAVFGDMGFRSSGMSEDCLYLNVWTPAKSGAGRLPVLVYFYGGGFVAGDGSEPRYDGESMARKGIVSITVNYRLGIFGFLSHPELTLESGRHASGNYGLLDQNAALRWVQQNVAAFGGDPKRVVIAGESAGSISVSAQMASPLSKGLFAAAIGESGSILGTLSAAPLAEGEQAGTRFATNAGAASLAALRAMTADRIQEATKEAATGQFPITVDGYFLPEVPAAIFAAGRQAHVPLLAGWNSEEMNWRMLLGSDEPTLENYQKAVRKLYDDRSGRILELYPASTNADVARAATDLSSDRFTAFSTWKWADICVHTSGEPVYLYLFSRPRPPMNPEMGDVAAGLAGGIVRGSGARTNTALPAGGAVHSAEIEYALGNLATNKVYAWTPDDYKVSRIMEDYFANFVKTGNPVGPGLPDWPALSSNGPSQVMRIDVESAAEPQRHRERYLFLDQLAAKPAK